MRWELLGHAGELLAQGARAGEDGRAPSSVLVARPLGRQRGSGRRRPVVPVRRRGLPPRDRARSAGGPRRARAPAPPDGVRLDHGRPRRVRPEGGLPPREGSRGVPRVVPGLAAPDVPAARARAPPDVARGERRPHGRRRGVPGPIATRPSRPRPRSRPPRPTPRAGAWPTASSPASRSRSRSASCSEKPVVSAGGLRAQFVSKGGATLLVVTRPGRQGRHPAVSRSWAPTPRASRSTPRAGSSCGTRRLRRAAAGRGSSTSGARASFDPAAAAEPEILVSAGGCHRADAGRADRYTTSLGFSPDGRLLLVVCEGFTADGTRIPKRHVLCDVEGGRRPVLVDRPFSAPGVVDWTRLAQVSDRLSG